MNETIKIIENLKTIRNFSDKDISKKDLSTILKSCVNAATASCRQTYSIIVVEDKKVMREIGYVGSIMLIFCVDFNRVIDTAQCLGYKYNQEVPIVDFITGSTDTILAAQTAAIAAKSIGIDSLFSNCVHRGDINRIYKLLDLPEKHCFPSIALIFGYSDEKEIKSTSKGRLSGSEIIHYNKLNNVDFQNIIKEYDSQNKHFLSLISNWKEKGYEHYLDYFYEKWCGYSKISKEEKFKNKNNQYEKVEVMLKKVSFL